MTICAPRKALMGEEKEGDMKNEKINCNLFILLLQLTWLPWVLMAPQTEPTMPAEVIEEECPLIRWKQEDTYVEETLEVSIEKMELEEVKGTELQSLGVFTITAYCPCTECSDD